MPTPKPPAPPPPSAHPAYIVYIAYSHGGKEVFGVIDEGTKALHIFPEDERSLVLVEGDVLPQLRGNERFRKFEASITQMGGALGATTLVDEGRRTAYLILSVFTRVGPYSYSPLLHDPQYAGSAVYLATCGLRSWGPTGVILDPATLEVFQGSKLDQDAYTPAGLVVDRYGGAPIYTVIAGGARPIETGDLQGFAFYAALPDHSNQITGGGIASNQAGSWGPRALTVFSWELLDAPPDNVLLQFKTDAELTLEAYNAGVRHGIPMALAAKDGNRLLVSLVGFSQLSPAQERGCYEEAQNTPTDTDYFEVRFEGVMYLLEDRMGLTFEEVGELLLRLAKAEKEGRFSQVYSELLPQRELRNLVRLFWSFINPAGLELPEPLVTDPRLQRYIRALAVEFERAVSIAGPFQPQWGTVIVELAKKEVKAKLLDLLLNALWGFLRGEDEPRFVHVFVSRYHVRIGKDRWDLHYHRQLVHEWIYPRLGRYGVPEGLPGDPLWLLTCVGMDVEWAFQMRRITDQQRTWLAFGFALVYAYKQYQEEHGLEEQDQTSPNPRFAPGFRHMLRMYIHAVRLALNLDENWRDVEDRYVHDHERGFVPRGVSVKGLTEVQVVMSRLVPRTELDPWTGKPKLEPAGHMDIAVVRYYDRPDAQAPLDIDRAGDHIREALACFENEGSYLSENPNLYPRGLDIAAVLLPTVTGDELAAVRRLAEVLAQEIRYQGVASSSLRDYDKRGEVAFLIWREVRDGKTVIVYSCFEKKGVSRAGPERLTKEEKEEIVRGLMIDDPTLPILEYSPVLEPVPPLPHPRLRQVGRG